MKKHILLSLLIFTCAQLSFSQFLGMNVPDDKVAHYLTGAWLTSVCQQNDVGHVEAGALVLGLCVAKEVLDMNYTKFDVNDILCTMAGWALSGPVNDFFKVALQPLKPNTELVNKTKEAPVVLSQKPPIKPMETLSISMEPIAFKEHFNSLYYRKPSQIDTRIFPIDTTTEDPFRIELVANTQQVSLAFDIKFN